MSSKKEEERNEKVIRGLMKLPPNRRCINCNGLGPQYVCTNFWTFVCIACSGIHREFTHRVKSVSMAKFTSQEVEALQRGGNQRAREIYLKDWDLQRQRLPDSSKVDRVREFIKHVYEDRKYAGGKVLDKPPRDAQGLRNHEDETRRASSYHSYSQSPPYEYQYEDRKYGKQVGVLSRKPGSDRGYYEGKISSFSYSPGRSAEQIYEDRFANEGSIARVSDYSVSSMGDPFRSGTQSPNFQGKPNSPPMHHLKDIIVADARSETVGASGTNAKTGSGRVAHTQNTASSSSFGSFDDNSMNSGSFIDVVSETEQSGGSQLSGSASVPSVQKPTVSANAVGNDLFGMPQQSGGFSDPSINLFEKSGNFVPPSEDLFKATNMTFAPSTDLFERPVNPAAHQEYLFKPTDMPLPPPIDLFKKPADSAPSSQDLFKPQDKTMAPSVDFFSDTNHQHLAATSSEQKPPAVSFPHNEGWATFDLPQATVGINYAPHASVAPVAQVSSINSSMQWPSVSFESHVTSPPAENQWHGGVSGLKVEPFGPPVTNGGQSSSTADQKSTNPFDFSFDSNMENSSVLLNMSSLQTALPDPLLAPSFVEDFNQSWFPSNTIGPYIPAAQQGGLAYMSGEAPASQFTSIPSQGPVASLGGNPFA